MSHCVNCGQIQGDKCKFKRCSDCETVKYCSKKCQQAHWKDHKSICCAIKELLRQNRESMKHDSDAERVNYVSHLTPKQRAKVARLIGNKCLISCILSGKQANALFDTGAQVSVALKPWLEANLPDYMLHDISDLLLDQKLDLKAANGTEIKYIGWTPIEFRLSNSREENKITVPFLVTETDINPPIVGFNVIELLITGGLNQQTGIETLLNEMTATFTDSSPDNVKAFVDLISVSAPTELCTLKTKKKGGSHSKRSSYRSYLSCKYRTT